MQRVSTAERSNLKKKQQKTNQTKKREIMHLTEGSDIAPHAAGGIFSCASVGGVDSERGETACGCWRQRGRKRLYITYLYTVPEPLELFLPQHTPYAAQPQMF